METIKIAHLYYDLLNLYGENGNVKSLIKHLENNNVKVITHFLSVDDSIDFQKYDLFYIGSGNKECFEIARNDILKRKKEITEAIKKNKFFIATGNAIDLFGKSFHTLEEKELETLNILKYDAYETDFRIVGEATFIHKEVKEEIIGFQNRFSVLKNVSEKNLFEVKKGTGYSPKIEQEGIQKNNFYGTYLLGPLLIRNPYFTEYLVEKILQTKNIPYQNKIEEFEIKAYEEYKKNLLNEKIED